MVFKEVMTIDYSKLFSDIEWLNLKDTKLLVGERPVKIFINTEPYHYILEIYLSEICIFNKKVDDMIHLDVLKRFLVCLFNIDEMIV
jgi:predicted transcriptional regulator